MIACRIFAMLKSLNISKNWSLDGLLDALSEIQIAEIDGKFKLKEFTKKTKKLLELLKLDFESI